MYKGPENLLPGPSSLGHPHFNFLGDPSESAQREWFPGNWGEQGLPKSIIVTGLSEWHHFPFIVAIRGTRDVYGSTSGNQEDNFYLGRSWTLGPAKTLPEGVFTRAVGTRNKDATLAPNSAPLRCPMIPPLDSDESGWLSWRDLRFTQSQPVSKQLSCLALGADNLLPGSDTFRSTLRNQPEDRSFNFWAQRRMFFAPVVWCPAVCLRHRTRIYVYSMYPESEVERMMGLNIRVRLSYMSLRHPWKLV